MTDLAKCPLDLPETLAGHWSTAEGRDMAIEYAVRTRTDLGHSNLTDLELANAVFMANRTDLDLIVYQTSAKERIRWLSVQLAIAQAALRSLSTEQGKEDHIVGVTDMVGLREAAETVWREFAQSHPAIKALRDALDAPSPVKLVSIEEIARVIDPEAWEEYLLEDGRVDEEVASIFQDAYEMSLAKAQVIASLVGGYEDQGASRTDLSAHATCTMVTGLQNTLDRVRGAAAAPHSNEGES